MDYYYGYNLFDQRDLNRLNLDISQGIVTPNEAVNLLQGEPCIMDEFLTLHPQLRDLDPPDDDASSAA